jgi:hypothetical protein
MLEIPGTGSDFFLKFRIASGKYFLFRYIYSYRNGQGFGFERQGGHGIKNVPFLSGSGVKGLGSVLNGFSPEEFLQKEVEFFFILCEAQFQGGFPQEIFRRLSEKFSQGGIGLHDGSGFHAVYADAIGSGIEKGPELLFAFPDFLKRPEFPFLEPGGPEREEKGHSAGDSRKKKPGSQKKVPPQGELFPDVLHVDSCSHNPVPGFETLHVGDFVFHPFGIVHPLPIVTEKGFLLLPHSFLHASEEVLEEISSRSLDGGGVSIFEILPVGMHDDITPVVENPVVILEVLSETEFSQAIDGSFLSFFQGEEIFSPKIFVMPGLEIAYGGFHHTAADIVFLFRKGFLQKGHEKAEADGKEKEKDDERGQHEIAENTQEKARVFPVGRSVGK